MGVTVFARESRDAHPIRVLISLQRLGWLLAVPVMGRWYI
jgi:hypothetical protein